MELEQLRPALHGVAAYKHLTDEPMMGLVLSLLDKLSAGDGTGALEDYTRLFYELRAAGCGGLGEWLHDQLRYQESPYARMVEQGRADSALAEAARRDVDTLAALAGAGLLRSAGADGTDRAAGLFRDGGRSAPMDMRRTVFL